MDPARRRRRSVSVSVRTPPASLEASAPSAPRTATRGGGRARANKRFDRFTSDGRRRRRVISRMTPSRAWTWPELRRLDDRVQLLFSAGGSRDVLFDGLRSARPRVSVTPVSIGRAAYRTPTSEQVTARDERATGRRSVARSSSAARSAAAPYAPEANLTTVRLAADHDLPATMPASAPKRLVRGVTHHTMSVRLSRSSAW